MSLAVALAVGMLGGAGAIARFLLDGAVSSFSGRRLPWGTLAVNLMGALALGVLTGAAVDGDALRLAGTGLIGAFTTFSTWMFESHRLGEDGELGWGLVNLLASLALGIAAVWLGRELGVGAVSEDCLKLTVYFGERDRAGGRYLADALIDVFAALALRTSLVMRGTTGFGAKQHLRTDRLLSLSEDLPLVAVAVDTRERVLAALRDVEALAFDGLVTLERARIPGEPPADEPGAAKLTVYVGRGERVGSRPAYEAIVAALRRHGVAGATVLLGVDGTAHGERRRARFLGRNAGVPLMVVSVGEPGALAAALPEIAGMLEHPFVTWERVRVCKRDGQVLDAPEPPAAGDAWQKLMVYASEQSRHDGRPLYAELVRRLRGAGAAGATTLRGIWGYHGDHAPHGDSVWQLRRRVPVLTVVVDTPAAIRRWYAIADELTAETGLVTSELVPTAHPRPATPVWASAVVG